MAIRGIGTFNKSDGTEKIFAAINNDLQLSSGASWIPQNLALTANQEVYFATLLDYLFEVNYADPNHSYDGTNWSTTTNLTDSPQARFIRRLGTRLYLYDVQFGTYSFPSRVYYSDLPKNNTITWDLEWGTDLAQSSSSKVITSAGSAFITRGIKVGDPVFITSGTNQGQYTVYSVDSETQITLVETLTNAQTNSSFWVGGNWFDVTTDDGDTGKGIMDSGGRLLCFKVNSLHRYDGASLLPINGAPGTTSPRSIGNVRRFTIYFNKGFWSYDSSAGQSQFISKPIQDIIDGMLTSNYDKVVFWKDGTDIYRAWVGNILDTETSEVLIENCVVSYDVSANSWTVGKIPDQVTSYGELRESNDPHAYIGTYDNEVHQWGIGLSDDGNEIELDWISGDSYPANPDVLTALLKIKVWCKEGQNAAISYRLIGRQGQDGSFIDDDGWTQVGQIHDSISEFYLEGQPIAHGLKIRVQEISDDRSPAIKRIAVYHRPEGIS